MYYKAVIEDYDNIFGKLVDNDDIRGSFAFL